MKIRIETAADIPAIEQVITDAMRLLAQATGTEAAIVERLRVANALSLSLVAEEGGEVIGYLAASAARVGQQDGWSLIGPVAVAPAHRLSGVGTALMREALRRLRETSRGAALVGDPVYYARFGFRTFPELFVPDCPPEVVQAISFDGAEPCGELIHHPAFGLDQ
ncbi:N-acetyltransferase [Tsuneonella suprasediminis]|uniref:N-acetyltransferase n=1 Tax=Tsuneonella suprasediminis TaxID=2306996 RepID=A0A419R594_9SPHN|nr:N-acetyltransferase [Tsuneonella suprasediminis]RJX70878.1 N-acetyltransferase [Tsuneonella suprasediminis]